MSIGSVDNSTAASALQSVHKSHSKKHKGKGFASAASDESSSPFSLGGGATASDLTAIEKKVATKNPQAASAVEKIIQNFSSIDTNNDGKISASEFEQYVNKSGFTIPPASATATTTTAGANTSTSDDPSTSALNTSLTSLVAALPSLAGALGAAIGKYAAASGGTTNTNVSSLLKSVTA